MPASPAIANQLCRIVTAFLCDLSSITSLRLSETMGGHAIGTRTREGEAIPERWRDIASVDKEPLTWPDWSHVEPPPPPPKGKSSAPRDEFRTSAAQRTQVVIPLAEVNGAGIESARLRITAWPRERNFDVTATLEIEGGRGFITIARVDAWPPDPHDNTRRDICRRLGIPVTVEEHHVHRFDDNACIGREAFHPFGNLPIARPISEATLSFKKFMAIVETEFRISGIRDFPSPPNWGALL